MQAAWYGRHLCKWQFHPPRRGAPGRLASASDPLETLQHSYGYDKLNRLTGDQRSTGSTSWSYDAADELTQVADTTSPSTSTLSYDAAAELTRFRSMAGTTPTQDLTLSYDANGDRTGQTDSVSGAASGYGYDKADRLVTATVGSTSASCGYDGDGLRTSKTVNGTTTQQTWDAAAGLPLVLQDGTTRYVTGPGGLPIEQVAADGTVLYDVQDQLGSTRGLLNGAGQTVATYTYDPYGRQTAHTGTASTPFGYVGQYTDTETGLQYLRARYYDPATAQFLTRDPLQDVSRQSYGYAADDPLNHVDPSGKFWWIIAGALVNILAEEIVTNGGATCQQLIDAAIVGDVTGGLGAVLGPECEVVASSEAFRDR
jgi:RHS repeat-associated protein